MNLHELVNYYGFLIIAAVIMFATSAAIGADIKGTLKFVGSIILLLAGLGIGVFMMTL